MSQTYQAKVIHEQGGDVVRVKSGGKITVDSGGILELSAGAIFGGGSAGTPAGAGVAASEGIIVPRQTLLTLTGALVTLTDTGTNGAHGSLKIYDFPEGHILLLGAIANCSVTAGVGGVADGAVVLQALGTGAAATDNATLVGSGEADWLASNSATLVGGIGTWATQNGSLPLNNGVATARDLNLNVVVADADVSAGDTIAYTGSILITWVLLGDR